MTWKNFLHIVEIRTKVVSLSTFLLALASSVWQFSSVSWTRLAVLFLAVLAVDMGTTAFNTFFDFERGVDSRKTNQEKDKVLVHDRVAPGAALLVAVGLFAFASILGVLLALEVGWPLLALGLVSLLVAYQYSGGTRPLSSTPWGEFFAGFFLGTVLWVVVAFVAGGPDHWEPRHWLTFSLLSLPSFFFIASILTVNNCCDRDGDRDAGRRTLVLILGPRSDVLVIAIPLVAYLAMAILASLDLVPAPFWFAVILGPLVTVPTWRGMYRRGFRHETKGPNMGAVSRSFLFYTLLSGIAWIWALVLRA